MTAKGGIKCMKGCIRCAGWLPVIFLALIIAWSYYAFVYSLSYVLVQSVAVRVIYLVLYHVFLFIFGWSYAKVILEPPRVPPNEFYLTDEDWAKLRDVHLTDNGQENLLQQIIDERRLPIRMVGRQGNINFCHTCGLIKPDRAHHCSTCGRCVLQMDHHCPWTNNCVGFHNHKFFVIFLMWGSVYCFYITCTTASYFADFFISTFSVMGGDGKSQANEASVDRFQVLFLFIVSLMFGICQFALGAYHCYLVSRNQTTLDSLTPPKFRDGTSDERAFDRGKMTNLRQVFGNNPVKAVLPIFTTQGDGFNWYYRSASDNAALLENGPADSIP